MPSSSASTSSAQLQSATSRDFVFQRCQQAQKSFARGAGVKATGSSVPMFHHALGVAHFGDGARLSAAVSPKSPAPPMP